MGNASTLDVAPGAPLQTKQVFLIAAICVVLGLGIGYASRGIERPSTRAVSVAARTRVPTLGDMKLMADKKAAPLLAQLQAKPNDSALLAQVAAVYHGSHQFKEASGYYDKAVQADPINLILHTNLV